MKTKQLIFLLICSLLLAWTPNAPKPVNKKLAYKLHYRGSIQYTKGNFNKAVGYFQRAYDIEPTNVNFAFSLAISLGRMGNAKKGLEVLQKGTARLNERNPEYLKNKALALYFEGAIHCYSGEYDQAIPALKKSIEAQKELDDPKVLSIFNNTLGYAQILDQGSGSHARAELAEHYHVHKRDIVRSLEHFEAALVADVSNKSALENYKMLCDSLEIPPRINLDSLVPPVEVIEPGRGYRYLPGNAFRAMEFTFYDEVLLLMDISGSMVMESVTCMDTTRFTVMKQTAQYLIKNLPASTSIGLGTIGGDCGTTPKLWSTVGSMSRKDLKYAIDFMHPDGTTPLLTRLRNSPELFTKKKGTQKAIFLISDGANICRAGGEGICEWAEAMARRNITINIMTFLDADLNHINAFAEYTCLADNTHGKILYMDNLSCSLEYYTFNLVESCHFYLPEMQRVDCWGPSVKSLWAVFPEQD